MESVLLEVAGHRRSSPVPGDDAGLSPRPPTRNKGERYPADPPTVEEIGAVMRAVGDRPDGQRLRARYSAAVSATRLDSFRSRSHR